MTVYLIKKEKNKIYRSEDIVKFICGRELLHTPKGAPYLGAEIQHAFVSGLPDNISVTDTKNYWACAFSSSLLGIDMEEISRRVSSVAVRSLHKKEKEYLAPLSEGSSEWKEEFLSIWTKKEAYSKYLGLGLGAGFSKFCVVGDDAKELSTGLYCRKYGDLLLGATEEIEIEQLIYSAPQSRSAFEAGADILDMFGCSSDALSKKLLARGYAKKEIEEAVSRLEELGFLNDTEYARSLAKKFASKGFSSRRIELELEKKGIDKEKARDEAQKYKEGLCEDEFSEEYSSDRERAENAAQRIIGDSETGDKAKSKIARKLSSLGYDAPLIYDILESISHSRR